MIRVWSVESAGNLDRDMELRLWFKGFWGNKVKQDLRKGRADLFALQSFIGHFIIGDADGNTALSGAQAYQPLPSGVVNKFVGYLGDAHKKDPIELTSKLRESPALLQADEKVELAFKGGRDLFLITTKRIISINRKGITGKSTDYRSFPLMYNKAFRIETEGHLLNGAEVKVYTNDDDIKQEFAKGNNESVWEIHELLSEKMLNNPQNEIGEVDIQLSTEQQPSYAATQPTRSGGPVVAAQIHQPQKITFQVQVPVGVVSGQLQIQHPQTQQMLIVTVPIGVAPGEVFSVTA